MLDFQNEILSRLNDSPHQTKLTVDGTEIDNEGFLSAVSARARVLRENGVQAGDICVVETQRGHEFLIDVSAIWSLRGCVSPVDPSSSRRVADLVQPHFLISNTIEPGGFDRNRQLPDTAAILYTSGSSGVPKGVLLSPEALFGNAIATVNRISMGSGSRLLVNTPFHFTSFLCHFLASLVADVSLIAIEEKLFPKGLLNALATNKATAFGGAPIQIRWIAEHADSDSLTWAMSSGDRLPVSVIETWRQRHVESALHTFYGLTEVGGRCCSLMPEKLPEKAGAVGKPIPGLALRLIDDSGRNVQQGDHGEVVVSGDYLMVGYLSAADADVKVDEFSTGDIGYLDADGDLWIVGRKDDVFKVSGQKVSGNLIADAMLALGYFDDVVVLPTDDPDFGTVPTAYVVASTPPARHMVLRGLRQRLPTNHIPRKLLVVPQIFRTGSGKLDRTRLGDLRRNASELD